MKQEWKMPVKYSQSLEINQPYFLVGGKSEQRSIGGGACVLFSSAVAFAEAHRYTCVWLSSFRWLSSSTVECIRQASSLQRLSKPTLQLTSALKKSGQCRQVSRRCGVFVLLNTVAFDKLRQRLLMFRWLSIFRWLSLSKPPLKEDQISLWRCLNMPWAEHLDCSMFTASKLTATLAQTHVAADFCPQKIGAV
jgi:hypothetical protein